MPRPFCCRRIGFMPGARYFKPHGASMHTPMHTMEEIILTMDELEAVRLADYEALYQEQAAEKMQISRPTFGRIVESAHKKIADALVNGRALRIEGGNVEMQDYGEGRGGMRAGGSCICPKCGGKVPHRPGMPCKDERCPTCGVRMMREGSPCHGRLQEKRAGQS